MTDLARLLEDLADTPGPPSGLRSADIFRKGRRRRRWSLVGTLTASGAAVVTLATCGIMFVTHDRGAGPVPVAPAGRQAVQWHTGSVWSATAGDTDHLYAVVLDCPDNSPTPNAWHTCNQDLIRSADGGRSWQVRNHGLGSYQSIDLTPLTDDILLAQAEKQISPGALPQSGEYVSIDGGQHWKPVQQQDTPTPSIPADGWIEPSGSDSAKTLVGDPRLGQTVPLASSPPIQVAIGGRLTATGGLWVAGDDKSTGRPVVAVSTDAGMNWSTHAFTDLPSPGQSSYNTELASHDGHTVYAVSMTGVGLDGDGRAWVHRSTDGGQTWQLVDPGGTAPWSYGGGSSFVTPDGAHVIADLGRDQKVTYRISWDAGAHYAPVTLSGLPTEGIYGAGTPVQTLPGGGYLAYAPGDAVYVSSDGLNWRRVVPHIP